MDILSASASTTTVGDVFSTDTAVTSGSDIASLVQAQEQKRLQTQIRSVSASYSGQFTQISDQQAQLANVTSGINSALTQLQGARGGLSAISNSLDNLVSTLTKATTATTPAQASSWARTFQAQLDSLGSIASSSSQLLTGTGEVHYATTASGGGVQTFLGDNMASGYTIAASDGNVWASSGYNALVAYKAYPNTTANKSSSTSPGGTTLQSLSGSSITFTVGANTAKPQQLTGTVSKTGLGVLDPWMYDNFSTASGVARAKADLTNAQAAVQAEQARYDSAIAVAQYYSDKTQLAQSVLSSQLGTLSQQESDKLTQLQKQSQQQQTALANSLQGAATVGSQLADQLPVASGGVGDILTASSSTPDYPVFDVFA